jgi:hypothetical protein
MTPGITEVVRFKPTYLYIKHHSITGKCYFGKTINDPTKYNGSGVHWTRHCKKHGYEHVETLWYKLFTNQIECTRIALLFSEQQDIVKSDKWLNLMPENGLYGIVPGTKHTKEHNRKLGLAISKSAKTKRELDPDPLHFFDGRRRIPSRVFPEHKHLLTEDDYKRPRHSIKFLLKHEKLLLEKLENVKIEMAEVTRKRELWKSRK